MILLISCNTFVYGEPQLIGRVVDSDRSRILVVADISLEETKDSVESILSSGKFKEAYWVKISNSKRYKSGDQVKVWFHNSDDSNPGQTKADGIKVIKE